mmetsp:Transcript_100852/g.289471  ORF Transcript_100852/g.289471 Transcript_100852/m.289471 type:complete len:176 (+) Transcript_100852:230-757(+)
MEAARNLKADLNTLEDDGTRSTASVADGGSGKASIIILQHREGRAHDARTRAPDRVADGHGTTMHVDLGVVEVKQVHVREGHNRKRFINLVEINIARRHASMSEGLGHRERRRGGELNRVLRPVIFSILVAFGSSSVVTKVDSAPRLPLISTETISSSNIPPERAFWARVYDSMQ